MSTRLTEHLGTCFHVAGIALTVDERLAIKNKLRNMVQEMKQGGGIPGMSDADSDLITALAQSAESALPSTATATSASRDQSPLK